MQFWKPQKYKYAAMTALCLLAIGYSAAYAAVGFPSAPGGPSGSYTNKPTPNPQPSPGMTPSTDEELMKFHSAFLNYHSAFNDFATQQVRSANSGNAAAATNAGAIIEEQDIIGTHTAATIVQQTYSLLDGLIMHVQSQTKTASEVQGASIKARQSEQYVYAAADDLANAMTLSILNHYGTMTKKQIIAELVTEGKSYGYLPANFDVNAANTKGGFSLIAKAWASTGQKPNNIWAMGSDKGGAPIDASGANDQYGVGNESGQLSVAKDRFRGNVYGAKLAFGAALPDEPDCGSAVATVECDSDMIGNRMATMRDKGPAMKKEIKTAVWNSKAGSSGGSSDNSDHSSFFISSAYAQSSGGGKVSQFVQKLAQAQQQSCDAHKPVDELQAPQECPYATARQNKFAQATAACCSGDAMANRAPAMNKTAIIENINGSAEKAAEPWEDD